MKLKAFQMWKNFDVNLNSTLCELPQYCCPMWASKKKLGKSCTMLCYHIICNWII